MEARYTDLPPEIRRAIATHVPKAEDVRKLDSLSWGTRVYPDRSIWLDRHRALTKKALGGKLQRYLAESSDIWRMGTPHSRARANEKARLLYTVLGARLSDLAPDKPGNAKADLVLGNDYVGAYESVLEDKTSQTVLHIAVGDMVSSGNWLDSFKVPNESLAVRLLLTVPKETFGVDTLETVLALAADHGMASAVQTLLHRYPTTPTLRAFDVTLHPAVANPLVQQELIGHFNHVFQDPRVIPDWADALVHGTSSVFDPSWTRRSMWDALVRHPHVKFVRRLRPELKRQFSAEMLRRAASTGDASFIAMVNQALVNIVGEKTKGF